MAGVRIMLMWLKEVYCEWMLVCYMHYNLSYTWQLYANILGTQLWTMSQSGSKRRKLSQITSFFKKRETDDDYCYYCCCCCCCYYYDYQNCCTIMIIITPFPVSIEGSLSLFYSFSSLSGLLEKLVLHNSHDYLHCCLFFLRL